jgi:hypothetical protein
MERSFLCLADFQVYRRTERHELLCFLGRAGRDGGKRQNENQDKASHGKPFIEKEMDIYDIWEVYDIYAIYLS